MGEPRLAPTNFCALEGDLIDRPYDIRQMRCMRGLSVRFHVVSEKTVMYSALRRGETGAEEGLEKPRALLKSLAPNLPQDLEQAVDLLGLAGADADMIAKPRLLVIAYDDARARQPIAQFQRAHAMHTIQDEI